MESNYTNISDKIKNILKRDSEVYLNILEKLKNAKNKTEKYLIIKYLLFQRIDFLMQLKILEVNIKEILKNLTDDKKNLLLNGNLIEDENQKENILSFLETQFISGTLLEILTKIEKDKSFEIDDILELKIFQNNEVYENINFRNSFSKQLLIFNNTTISPFFLNIDLDLDDEEILALIHIAKRKFKQEKETNTNLIFKYIVEKIEKLKLSKNKDISICDKFCDFIFLFDATILKSEDNYIKYELQNYYIKNYKSIDITYIISTYLKRLQALIKDFIELLESFKQEVQKNMSIYGCKHK